MPNVKAAGCLVQKLIFFLSVCVFGTLSTQHRAQKHGHLCHQRTCRHALEHTCVHTICAPSCPHSAAQNGLGAESSREASVGGAEASRLGRTKLHSAVCISAPTVAAAFKFGTRVRMLYAHVLLHFQSTILDGSRVGSHPTHARARTHPPHACTHLRSQPTPRLYLLQPSMYHMCTSLCQVSEREHVWFRGAQPLPLSDITPTPL